jgi:site-specific DNA-methyltransferase (adenine-specific)
MIGRLKFEIDGLVEEILDRLGLTDDQWRLYTFLDPAMGGGQFVKAIEARKRRLGCSDAQIRATVWGLENNLLRVRYAVNKHRLVGTYRVSDFLSEEFGEMKFDVVVGNPPYQGITAKKEKLWPKFANRALELATDNGIVAMIAPSVWMNKDITVATTFRKMLSVYQLDTVITDCSDYFPAVGEKIGAFFVRKCPPDGLTSIIHPDGIKDVTFFGQKIVFEVGMSQVICDKVDNTPGPRLRASLKRFLARRPSAEDFSQNYSITKTVTHTNPVVYSANEKWFTSLDTTSFKGPKVIFNNSGYYYSPLNPKYLFISDEEVALGNAFQLRVNSMECAENSYSYLTSKLYQFYMVGTKSGGFNASSLAKLPRLDCSKKWTDSEIYTHFGLTQEEIDYVEANVK